jgi:hypothetical protein
MKRYAACRTDGVIQFTVEAPGDAPPVMEGFNFVEVDAGFQACEHHYADGQIQPGALDVRSLEELKEAARQAIDVAAGAARMRYITEVPGQQATYMRKLEQARAYAAAGYTGSVPPYIQAEADAIGDTPQGAADAILATAALWDDVLSPGIEGARIGGKRAVTAANTAEAVQSAVAAAMAALAAI